MYVVQAYCSTHCGRHPWVISCIYTWPLLIYKLKCVFFPLYITFLREKILNLSTVKFCKKFWWHCFHWQGTNTQGVEIRKCCASYPKKVTCLDKILFVFLNIRYLQNRLLIHENQGGFFSWSVKLKEIELALWSIVWLRKTSDIVLIKYPCIKYHCPNEDHLYV